MATVRRVLAPNGGPYTGPGTNTWVLGDAPAAVVIDPGPDDDAHLEAVERALGTLALGAVLVTHSHVDHLPLAGRLAERHGVRVLRWPDLADGDLVRVGSLELEALHTPGHSGDHLCFWLPGDRVAFTGDLVLGRGSTLIAHPDGDVAQFLESLDRLRRLRPRLLFPGHWDPVREPERKLEEYRAHRLAREQQLLEELGRGPGSAPELTRRLYGPEGLPEQLMVAAELTVRAHLKKLVAEGRASAQGESFLLSAGPGER